MSTVLNPHNKKETLESKFLEKNPEISVDQKQNSSVDISVGVSEVSDFMDGLEVSKPSEKVSEKAREDDKKSQASVSRGQKGEDDQVVLTQIKPLKIPTQRIMVRRIRKELHKQIKDLMKQAKKEEKKGAFYFNEIMYQIRELKGTFSGLANATYEFVKNLYVSLFEGKVK